MRSKRGFTLIEIIVVLVILGIAVAFIIPSLISSIEQSKAQAAKNNLLAISAAEARYYEDQNPNSFCFGAGVCGSIADINNSLHVGISATDPFTYACSNTTLPYKCVAADGTDTLTLIPNANPPITCAGPSGSCP